MPTVEPIVPESTITLQARTQRPSTEILKQASETLRQARQNQEPGSQAAPEMGQSQSSNQPPPTDGTTNRPDEKALRARLFAEKMRRQVEGDRKKLDEERRQLEIERAGSRKWAEAAELVQQGRYLEAASKVGLTYEQLTQQLLNGGNVPPAQVAEQTASELVKKELEAFKKSQEEGQKTHVQAQYQETLKQMAAEAKYFVDSSDEFPLVKASERYQDIAEYIASEYRRTGRIIPVKEAVERREAEALEGLEELLKLEKVRAKALKESPKPKEEERVPQTLSQRTTAPVPAPKGLSDTERRQRAIDAFHGRLLP